MKSFKEFINEDWYDDDYDEGPEPFRDEDWIDRKGADQRIKYKLLISDYSDIAILEDKAGFVYALYIGGDEIDSYRLKQYTSKPPKRGYEDYDPDVETLDIDDDAIIALASDIPLKEIGYGMEEWEKGKCILVVMDDDLLNSFEGEFTDKVDKAIPEIREKMTKNPRQKLAKGKILSRKFGF